MNTIYPKPLNGIYTYKSPRFDGTFNYSQAHVLILGESDKRFLIQLRMPVGNHPQGHRMSVRKHNVSIHRPDPQPRSYDYSSAWWNN